MTEEKLDCFAGKEKELKVGKDTFVVKELSFGEKNEIRRKTMTYDSMTGKTDIDIYKMNELRLLKGIKSAPFEVNEVNIQKLKETIAAKLLLTINELSEVTGEDEKK